MSSLVLWSAGVPLGWCVVFLNLSRLVPCSFCFVLFLTIKVLLKISYIFVFFKEKTTSIFEV